MVRGIEARAFFDPSRSSRPDRAPRTAPPVSEGPCCPPPVTLKFDVLSAQNSAAVCQLVIDARPAQQVLTHLLQGEAGDVRNAMLKGDALFSPMQLRDAEAGRSGSSKPKVMNYVYGASTGVDIRTVSTSSFGSLLVSCPRLGRFEKPVSMCLIFHLENKTDRKCGFQIFCFHFGRRAKSVIVVVLIGATRQGAELRRPEALVRDRTRRFAPGCDP